MPRNNILFKIIVTVVVMYTSRLKKADKEVDCLHIYTQLLHLLLSYFIRHHFFVVVKHLDHHL